MKQRLYLWLFCLCITSAVYAQTTIEIRGVVVDRNTNNPIPGVTVRLLDAHVTATADERGAFMLRSSRSGADILMITGADIITSEISVSVPQQGVLDLETIPVQQIQAFDISVMGMIDESSLSLDGGDDGLTQDVSSSVIFSNDVFLRNAGFQFSQFRYRVRGYENRFQEVSINGVNFNDQIRGVFSHASIGALNDVTRRRNVTNYFAPSAYSFGSIGGSEDINMRAGSQMRGGRATVSLTNRNYYARAMTSYSTGMRDDGWAVTMSLGARYAHEGNIEGTFYRNIAYAFSVEKRFADNNHSISFVTFGSPVERGQASPSFQEAYDLTGNNLYNPNWGYQNGKRRNSRVVRAFNPTGIFSHTWHISEITNLVTGIGTNYSRWGGSALNWFNGADPRPDNWRNLPSNFRDSETAFAYYTYLWRQTSGQNRISQVNWDRLWQVNHLNNREGDGSAIYMVEERRNDLFETSVNSTLNTRLSDRVRFTAGIGLRNSVSKQFSTVLDLLGAQYLLDIDKFSERDFPGNHSVSHNDLNRPNRRVYKGDIFGYDFRFHVNSADVWFQQQHNYRRMDFHIGAMMKYSAIQREGMMRNGRHPGNSYGRGEQHDFIDFGMKTGATYKFSGRHFLTGNLSYQTFAPMAGQAYLSPRVMDRTADNLKSMGVFAADINYVFSMPTVSGRVSLFNTVFQDDMMRVSYYHDSERTFVNHVLNGLNRVHRGIELGVNWRMNNTWNFDFIGTAGEYFYSNNPMGVISFENGSREDLSEKVYMKNARIGGTPQTVGTVGINFFRNFWFLNLNINGFARNFIEIAPIRRLASNYAGIIPPDTDGFDEDQYNAYRTLTNQEKFDGGVTADFSIGRMIFLGAGNRVNFNLSINNILNDRNIRVGGFEQGRVNIDFPDRFTARYTYMQGINAFMNVSYLF
ncbi:MAG: carboxypeptidase-like regulatory domain-containing protein [Dysgonamonadaceae bacterium]|jgi:hypothetical protein|nr:carboxypeptidase-like regulatory domain-containing protein [Dysgonamonadaceae bacterium]